MKAPWHHRAPPRHVVAIGPGVARERGSGADGAGCAVALYRAHVGHGGRTAAELRHVDRPDARRLPVARHVRRPRSLRRPRLYRLRSREHARTHERADRRAAGGSARRAVDLHGSRTDEVRERPVHHLRGARWAAARHRPQAARRQPGPPLGRTWRRLARFDGRAFERPADRSAAAGRPGLVETPDGDVWVATEKGVRAFTPTSRPPRQSCVPAQYRGRERPLVDGLRGRADALGSLQARAADSSRRGCRIRPPCMAT